MGNLDSAGAQGCLPESAALNQNEIHASMNLSTPLARTWYLIKLLSDASLQANRTLSRHRLTTGRDPFLPFGDQFCCDAQRCLLVGFVLNGQYCMRRRNFVAPLGAALLPLGRSSEATERPSTRLTRTASRSRRPIRSYIGRGNSYSRGATPFSI